MKTANPRLASQEEWATAYFDLHGMHVDFVTDVYVLLKQLGLTPDERLKGLFDLTTEHIAKFRAKGLI